MLLSPPAVHPTEQRGLLASPPEGHVQSSQPRFGRVEVAARLESGVDVEGLAPCADIVVAGGIGRVIDQRLELEGLSGGNLFELELPDVSCLVLCVDAAVPSEGVGVTTDGDPVAHSDVVVDSDRCEFRLPFRLSRYPICC